MSTVLDAERYTRQLTETILFQGVQEDWIREWLRHANVNVSAYKPGEYLFRKEDRQDRLGILLRGTADVKRESEDGMMHMSTLKRNDLFGAASLFTKDAPYLTDVCCNENVRVLFISEEDMLKLLSENRTVLQNYLAYLNSRIRFLNKRLDAFSKNSVAARVMTYLSFEAKERVCRVKNYTKLSESLCVSRATLYRALDALEETHKIQRNGKDIILMEEYDQ